jgi:hypothetical protein
MDKEHFEFDFSGKSNEEVLSLFFHEIRSPVSIVAGHLSMLKIADLSNEDAQKLIDIALKGILVIQDNVNNVFQYLDEQRKD